MVVLLVDLQRWAFKLAIEQEDLNDFDTLKTRLEDVAKQMIGLKPTMATIHNSCDIVLSLLNKDKDLDELKKTNSKSL